MVHPVLHLPYLLFAPPQPAVATLQHDECDAQDPVGAVGRDDVCGGDGRAQVLPPHGSGARDEVGIDIRVQFVTNRVFRQIALYTQSGL